MKTVLVTGASGFVGGTSWKPLRAAAFGPTVWFARPAGWISSGSGRRNSCLGRCLPGISGKRVEGVDGIIHCAASPGIVRENTCISTRRDAKTCTARASPGTRECNASCTSAVWLPWDPLLQAGRCGKARNDVPSATTPKQVAGHRIAEAHMTKLPSSSLFRRRCTAVRQELPELFTWVNRGFLR